MKFAVYISKSIMLINTAKQYFNMQLIDNRRFMYNPKTNTLILGKQYLKNSKKIFSNHAEEHATVEKIEPYDDFIKGWIGTSKSLDNGVIHFAPQISQSDIEEFDAGFMTLKMFSENGATNKTVIRGFPGSWEQPLSNIIQIIKEEFNVNS